MCHKLLKSFYCHSYWLKNKGLFKYGGHFYLWSKEHITLQDCQKRGFHTFFSLFISLLHIYKFHVQPSILYMYSQNTANAPWVDWSRLMMFPCLWWLSANYIVSINFISLIFFFYPQVFDNGFIKNHSPQCSESKNDFSVNHLMYISLWLLFNFWPISSTLLYTL